MKLEKAIEILSDLLQTSSREESPDAWDAMKLGIEALKRVRHLRHFWGKDLNLRLPGETGETGEKI